MRPLFPRIVLTVLLAASIVSGGVVKVEVQSRSDVLGGRSFGLAGGFEKLTGKVYFAVDPANVANKIIADIGHAPVNAAGKVEFSSEFYLLKPKHMERANGTVLYEVSIRGRKGMLSFFNRAAGSLDPTQPEHFGDGFLLHQGYTLLWLGWQFDPPHQPGLMRMYPPVASDHGKPIRGLVRAEFVASDRIYDHNLADRDHVPYPVADPGAPENVMTLRDTVTGPRTTIPRTKWRFARQQDGKPLTDPGRVYLEGGFEPGRIYEVVYVAGSPPLVGAGPAAIRDLISHFKYEDPAAFSIPQGSIDHALGFGVSQSGRFLRTFLYYGFNGDENGRRVFDGVLAHVAGGGRGSFNHRFAQPSRDGHPFLNMLYPTDIFPFTDVEQTDPETGLRDGLLTHHMKPEWMPKVFYTNSSYEYWGRAASLIHTTIDGKRDAPVPANVRIYLFAGAQHGPAAFPPRRSIGQQLDNPTDFRWSMRALLRAMRHWVTEGKVPPPSRYPRIAGGTLVTPGELGFPQLPGVEYSTRIHEAYRADYGPEFYTGGIVTKEPPEIGSAFPMMVPAINADGNEKAGIRMPEVSVPLASYTGWNLFNANSGPTHELSSMKGSYIPFARTKAQREAAGDPRPSIAERYAGREEYLGKVSEAGLNLIDAGYLLDHDLPEIIRHAGRHWDYMMGDASGATSSQ